MNTQQPKQPYALRLADECEESAKAWANEIDTRERAAAELRRMQEEIDTLKAHIAAGARQEPVAWIRERDIGKPQPTCVSRLVYRSAAEADDGTPYVALYAAPPSPTAWNPLTDDDRAAAFGSMPDKMDGFLKKWGWLHFAKELERRCKEKNAPKWEDA